MESNWINAGLFKRCRCRATGKSMSKSNLRTWYWLQVTYFNQNLCNEKFFALLFLLSLETVRDDEAWKFLQIKFCSLIKLNINWTFTKHPRVYKLLQRNGWQILLADQAVWMDQYWLHMWRKETCFFNFTASLSIASIRNFCTCLPVLCFAFL